MATFLTEDLITQYEQKKVGLYSPGLLTYCSNNTCSLLVHEGTTTLENGQDVCGKCGMKACTSCKMQEHTGSCPKDSVFLKLMKKKKWQRCYNCKRIVEREEGCPHITCLCKASFCYL